MINPSTNPAFTGKITPPSPEYPQGQAKNVTTPGDGTGTPWEQQGLNDLWGLYQAIAQASALTPSGVSEKVGASQLLRGLIASVPTVTELLQAKLPAGHIVATRGYHAAGDGGAGVYQVKTAAQAATDGDVVDAYGNRTMGTGDIAVLMTFGRPVSSKQYGAKCDQSGGAGTNDGPAINAMLLAQKQVVLENNSLIGETLLLDNAADVRIQIAGYLYRNPAIPVFTMIRISECYRVGVFGGFVHGHTYEDPSVLAERFSGIEVNESHDVSIRETTVKWITSGGVDGANPLTAAILVKDSPGTTLDRCVATQNAGTSVVVSELGPVVIRDCTLGTQHIPTAAGAGVEGAPGAGLVTIQDSYIGYTLGDGVTIRGPQWVVSGNRIEQIPDGSAGIRVGDGTVAGAASSPIVESNTLKTCGTTAAFLGAIVLAGAEDALVQGNIIRDCRRAAVRCLGGTAQSNYRDTIQGNTLSFNDQGILVEGGDLINVAQNVIEKSTTFGVALDDSSSLDAVGRIYIQGNIFSANYLGGSGPAIYCVKDTTPPDVFLEAEVKGNAFWAPDDTPTSDQRFGLNLNGDHVRATVDGNTFSDTYTTDGYRYGVSAGELIFADNPEENDLGTASGNFTVPFGDSGRFQAVELTANSDMNAIVWPKGTRKVGHYQLRVTQGGAGGFSLATSAITHGARGTFGTAVDQVTFANIYYSGTESWLQFADMP
jgi:hypothetical protein